MRLFVGLFPPAPVVEALGRLQRELASRADKGALRLTPLDRVHLTVRFFGEVDDRRVEALVDDLGRAIAEAGWAGFDLEADGAGIFPERGSPRIFWVGWKEATSVLPALRQTLGRVVAGYGVRDEEARFRPHVTLARANEGGRLRESRERWLGSVSGGAIPSWRVDSVRLMRSELRPEGPAYSTRMAWDLA